MRGVLPAGSWGGLVGAEPVSVPGRFWAPEVPGVLWAVGLSAGPGGVEEFGVRLLGVEESEVPLLGVDPRSDPVPLEVGGVVVEVLVEGGLVLGGDDWDGF
ncbi:hypothetical protein SY2F82_65960 [Streptomyces sp. Y2F8-2]|uniref:hypothetical protein n=1 Tax=Streptomyces sp. Y2F8-2 TaxID=2759675 RepID=UPI0019032E42|nr:hypothetical protein [Streptomyces sp. Y2F8-2]GHK04799.1 hypothetical protein SY2F82_65960 [Streptomyces sp. Y2F8-2]